LGLTTYMRRWPSFAHVHQTGLAQNLKVLGDRLLTDVEVLADLASGARLISDKAENGLAARLDQSAQDGFTTHRHG